MDHPELNYQGLLTALFPVARDAGQAIMEIYKASEGIEIQRKADDSPLTQADQASNKVICEALEQLNPKFPIISEENKEIPYEERQNFSFSWMVDPLDGTKEFIKRNGEFTINIALIEKGNPILGVVHVPVSGITYYGFKGGGAFKILNDETVQQIGVDVYRVNQTGLRFVCSRSHMSEAVKNYLAQFAQPQTLSMGSSLKFLLIAEGKADIYPRLAPTMEWDTGAAQAILEAAGGKVLRHDDHTPLVYNKSNLLNPYFIALGDTSQTDLIFSV